MCFALYSHVCPKILLGDPDNLSFPYFFQQLLGAAPRLWLMFRSQMHRSLQATHIDYTASFSSYLVCCFPTLCPRYIQLCTFSISFPSTITGLCVTCLLRSTFVFAILILRPCLRLFPMKLDRKLFQCPTEALKHRLVTYSIQHVFISFPSKRGQGLFNEFLQVCRRCTSIISYSSI